MQKFHFVFVLLLIGGATASPALSLLSGATNLATNLIGTAGNAVGGAVNLAGNVAGGLIGTSGNIAGNIAGSAGNLVAGASCALGGAVQSLGQLVGGVIGSAGSVIGGSLNGVGNIPGVTQTIISKGVSDGLGFIKLGSDKVDVVGNIFGTSGITGNLFGLMNNVFTPLGKVVDGIVGTVTQIGGNFLTFPLKVVGWFSDRILGVVGALSKNPAEVVNTFIYNLSNLGTEIQRGINDFFISSSAAINDWDLKTALSAAREIIAPSIRFIYEQVNVVSKNIYDLMDKYNTGKNNIGTTAVNKVSDLLATLVTRFNTIFNGGRATAACLDPIRNSIVTYGQDALSYMSDCISDSISFNATENAEAALSKVTEITQYTKDVKCGLMECIMPAFMRPNDVAASREAGQCLAHLTNSVDGLLGQVQAKIDFTRNFLQGKLIVGMNNVQNCLNAKISETDAFVTSSFKALALC